MSKITSILYLIVFISIQSTLKSQSVLSSLVKPFKEIEMPFERFGNYIILKVQLENSEPLRFIFDTGAEHTILSKKKTAEKLHLKNYKDINIFGSDVHTPVSAFIARKVNMNIMGLETKRDMIVLNEDIFQFDKFIGLNVDGILGINIFRNYVVRIDFIRKMLTVTAPEVFEANQLVDYDSLRIEIYKSKPYINGLIKVGADTAVNLRLLLDTCAGVPLLLYAHTVPGLSPPRKNFVCSIGSGMGGALRGYVGRIQSLQFGNITIKQPISYFQELEDKSDSSALVERSGIMGNEILFRFKVVIDFARNKFYLKKEDLFKDDFIYDRSGIDFIAGGEDLNRFIINNVTPNSPASEAGLKEHDEIIKIGWDNSDALTCQEITRRLQSRVGETVSLTVKRGDNYLRYKIKLRDLL